MPGTALMKTDALFPFLARFFATRAGRRVGGTGRVRRRPVRPIRSTRAPERIREPDALVGLRDDLRAILSQSRSDSALRKALAEIGYDPALEEDAVATRRWLINVLDQVGAPFAERVMRLRPLVEDECERIGLQELASRTLLDEHEISGFLAEGHPSGRALRALEAYQFGDYRDLQVLLRGHFYEGFLDFLDGGWHEAVDEFVAVSPPGHIQGAIADINRLLHRVPMEDELRRTLDELGSYFAPEMQGLTQYEWLCAVRDQLVRSTG